MTNAAKLLLILGDTMPIETYYFSGTGNQAATNMTGPGSISPALGHPGVPCGVYIDLVTATAADIVIKDSRGFTIFTKTSIAADTYYPFGDTTLPGTSCSGVPTITATNVSNSSTGTWLAWMDVKR